jgi:hypothetical protein
MAGSPLRRASDQVEEVGRRTCLAAALLSIPVAIGIAIGSHDDAAGAAQRHASSVHTTEAVTLEDSSRPAMAPPIAGTYVKAEWTAPDGDRHEDTVEVPPGTPAGERVSIWQTDTGELSEAPPARTQLVFDAIFLALGIILLTAAAAFVAFRLLRLGLDRWRLHEWDQEWEDFEARQRREL